jgi:hypothetical protein
VFIRPVRSVTCSTLALCPTLSQTVSVVITLIRRRWEDNIKIDLQEVRWEGMDWIDLAQGRDRWRALVHVVMNLRVP